MIFVSDSSSGELLLCLSCIRKKPTVVLLLCLNAACLRVTDGLLTLRSSQVCNNPYVMWPELWCNKPSFSLICYLLKAILLLELPERSFLMAGLFFPSSLSTAVMLLHVHPSAPRKEKRFWGA